MRHVALARVLLLSPLLWIGCAEPAHVERSWNALGEPAAAEVYTTTASAAEALLDEFEQAVERVAAIASVDLPESELSRLNAAAAESPFRVSDQDLYRTILLALDYARVTGGAYDPTAGPLRRLWQQHGGTAPEPEAIEDARARVGWQRVVVVREARAIRLRDPGMSLDLGAVLTGLAVDVAARSFSRPGSRAGMIRLGGVVYAWNKPPEAEAWSVEIDDPRYSDRRLARIEIVNRVLAVCSADEILDPRTGRRAESDVIVAVAVADSGADAAALSAALVVGGSGPAGSLLSKTRRVEAVLVVRDGEAPTVMASASLKGRLELSDELAREAGGSPRYLLPAPEGL